MRCSAAKKNFFNGDIHKPWEGKGRIKLMDRIFPTLGFSPDFPLTCSSCDFLTKRMNKKEN